MHAQGRRPLPLPMAGAECSLFPPRLPLLLNGYRVLGTLFIGTTNIASGRLDVSLCLPGKRQGKMYLRRVLFVVDKGTSMELEGYRKGYRNKLSLVYMGPKTYKC
eukprot:1149460-Pelagomonas_calceolata.AAC.1